MSEKLTMRAMEGCDSECYVRHHLCAVREVRRLRALLDELADSPKEDRDGYSRIRMILEWTQTDLAHARERIAVLERLPKEEEEGETVPAAWLAKANREITRLNGLIALKVKP